MNQLLEDLIEQLATSDDEKKLEQLVGLSLAAAEPAAVGALVTELARQAQQSELVAAANGWRLVIGALSRRLRQETALPQSLGHAIGLLYSSLGPNSRDRHQLLTMLSSSMDEDNLLTFATLICDDPPAGIAESVAPLLPLFSEATPVHCVFPQLLACLGHPALAPAVLDLANSLTRQGTCDRHPAADRSGELIRLLQGVTCELERLQHQALPASSGKSQQSVGLGIGLAISLCDALALIGDSSARGPLATLLELQHRRLRVEAAAALARLGDQQGAQSLAELASEPIVRLRALHYAEELGIAESIAEEYRSEVAIAEAELVTYLAEPTIMGTAPSRCEVVDTRTLYWPGYEEPRNCYLFRFTYTFLTESGTRHRVSNVGIAGPVVHSVNADVSELPIDDIYALFAGWYADHESIRETSIHIDPAWPDELPRSVRGYVDRLREEGFEAIEPVMAGEFFGEDTLIARATQADATGIAVVDENAVLWHPTLGLRPLGPTEVYCIYKGRRLLEAFN